MANGILLMRTSGQSQIIFRPEGRGRGRSVGVVYRWTTPTDKVSINGRSSAPRPLSTNLAAAQLFNMKKRGWKERHTHARETQQLSRVRPPSPTTSISVHPPACGGRRSFLPLSHGPARCVPGKAQTLHPRHRRVKGLRVSKDIRHRDFTPRSASETTDTGPSAPITPLTVHGRAAFRAVEGCRLHRALKTAGRVMSP